MQSTHTAARAAHGSAPMALFPAPGVRQVQPSDGWQEALMAPLLRLALRLAFKSLIRPPTPVGMQRAIMRMLTLPMPSARGVTVHQQRLGALPVERIVPQGARPQHALLYMHGGAMCLGSPRTHRSITTQLAVMAHCEVMVPDYRLAPEHPFPAQIEDMVTAYRQLLADGYKPEQIAVAGDSAGGSLTLLATAAFKQYGLPAPQALLLLSPAVDMTLSSESARTRKSRDPLVNLKWARQAVGWYQSQHGHPLADIRALDLTALPPMMIQVGDDEVLLDDSLWLAQHVAAAGRHAELEVCMARWHVFQIHAASLPGAKAALGRLAGFLREHWATGSATPAGMSNPSTRAVTA